MDDLAFKIGINLSGLKSKAKIECWDEWLKKPVWSPSQAVCLFFGIDPEQTNQDDLSNLLDIIPGIKGKKCLTPIQWKLFALERKLPVSKPIENIQHKPINLLDWLNKEQITLDDALLLAMGQNPVDFDIFDTELFWDEYQELFKKAKTWVDNCEIKVKAILTDDGSSEYREIVPFEFFRLAKANNWFLPEAVHEWLDNIEKQQCVTWYGDIQPLEPLTDEEKQRYNNCAAWSWVDAIYILQGYKPVFQLSTEQVRSHFLDLVNYFTQSMQLGNIGKEINQSGVKSFIDSPANWQAFWLGISKHSGNVASNDDSSIKPRKKLIPIERETTESLLLIYEITKKYNVEHRDDLPGPKAWGKIVSGEFTSDLIKVVSDTKKSITLKGGEKLDKQDFNEKYRRRFK
ncbi:hypothetical protein [Methylomonas koyamae]|uniref:hypothetical protein n=1 Tax=Methylomonas koyamae TaxID=702114 RepID=UPI000BC32690|nr:hypothetical protein [Methylomonas koyamae]ATG89136.1 hypothetical protein MKLM6_0867 [Methylomonas koyamae]